MISKTHSAALVALTLLCQLIQLPATAAAENAYPIVLVHGFTGWGPDEIKGYNYWGGRDDIAAMLTDAGHPTYTGVVGPLTSNWDRACELYAYIKGGRVDYGASHAARFGHQRYGRTFSGVLPDWGETGPADRIHLLGHSQGGQTSRVLVSLLQRGDALERQAGGEVHPLFDGGRQWVHSVTTLASPHDGSTLSTLLKDEAGYLLNWLLGLTNYLSGQRGGQVSYDFKLDQWGIFQDPKESDEDFRARLANSHIWNQQDIALWDLRPAGAMQLNQRHAAVDSVYYFSWATQDTMPGLAGKAYLPGSGMNLGLLAPALAIGRYVNKDPGYGLPDLDQVWWPNDGAVNTVSMSGPKLGSRDRIINVGDSALPAALEPGLWYFMGVLGGWDHLDIIGLQTGVDFGSFYQQLAQRLTLLPAATNQQ